MQKNTDNIYLIEDKASAEKLFSKEAFAAFNKDKSQVPAGYFAEFETQLMNQIHSSNKESRGIFTIPKWGQLAIAASFFTIIATTYILIQNNSSKTVVATNIKIQDISTSEIVAYINENEELAELDWQAEISKEGKHLESLNNHLIKDSNTSQQ